MMDIDTMRAMLEGCVRCGECRAKCPSLDANAEGKPGWETHGPRGRMILAQGLIDGKIRPTGPAQDGIFTCFVCNQCVLTCPSRVDVAGIVLGARIHLLDGGCVAPQVLQVHEAIASTGNMFGLDQEDRVDLWSGEVSEIIEERLGKHSETLFFVGCQSSFKGALASVPASMVRILDKLGEDFTILGEEETCCGNPVWLTGGSDDTLRHIAEENTRKVEALGARRAIFTCPGCYRMFKHVYPKLLGKPITFTCMMSSEYLAEKIRKNGVAMKHVDFPGRVVYHDPCELGRHAGVYDAPREVLKAIPGIDLVEFKDHKENCNCCGMGGGVAMHDASVSEHQANMKAEDIDASNATMVVTHCPACFQGIENACNALKRRGKVVGVVDLADVVARALCDG